MPGFRARAWGTEQVSARVRRDGCSRRIAASRLPPPFASAPSPAPLRRPPSPAPPSPAAPFASPPLRQRPFASAPSPAPLRQRPFASAPSPAPLRQRPFASAPSPAPLRQRPFACARCGASRATRAFHLPISRSGPFRHRRWRSLCCSGAQRHSLRMRRASCHPVHYRALSVTKNSCPERHANTMPFGVGVGRNGSRQLVSSSRTALPARSTSASLPVRTAAIAPR